MGQVRMQPTCIMGKHQVSELIEEGELSVDDTKLAAQLCAEALLAQSGPSVLLFNMLETESLPGNKMGMIYGIGSLLKQHHLIYRVVVVSSRLRTMNMAREAAKVFTLLQRKIVFFETMEEAHAYILALD